MRLSSNDIRNLARLLCVILQKRKEADAVEGFMGCRSLGRKAALHLLGEEAVAAAEDENDAVEGDVATGGGRTTLGTLKG